MREETTIRLLNLYCSKILSLALLPLYVKHIKLSNNQPSFPFGVLMGLCFPLQGEAMHTLFLSIGKCLILIPIYMLPDRVQLRILLLVIRENE